MSTRKNYNRENNHMMMLAFKLASKKIGQTSLNPSVGCVITNKNNIIGYGSTSSQGYPHAEFNAIKSCQKNLEGSTIYISLEPCTHHGKTPPCSNLIIKSKVDRELSVPNGDVRLFIPPEKCCVYSEEKLV